MANRQRILKWVVAIVLGAGLLYLAFQADGSVQEWQRVHRWRHHQELNRVITRITDWPVHVAIGLLLAGVAWLRGSKRWARIFLSMVLAAALAGVAAYGLKVAIGRPRPAVKVERVWHGGDLRPGHHAFPSGHSAASAAFFGVLLFVCWRLGLALSVIPVLVGVSRILLGAHYLSDVVGGILLGVLVAAVVAAFLPSARSTTAMSG